MGLDILLSKKGEKSLDIDYINLRNLGEVMNSVMSFLEGCGVCQDSCR